MNVLMALGVLANLASTAATLTATINQITGMLNKASFEGRQHLTPDEWAQIAGLDDSARAMLADTIAKSKVSTS